LYEYCQNKRTLQINSNKNQTTLNSSISIQLKNKQQKQEHRHTALQHGGGGKKLVMVEICVCVENSAVEKQAAAQQISPTSNTLAFKHSQALTHAACAV
jgi:hypothetical protein